MNPIKILICALVLFLSLSLSSSCQDNNLTEYFRGFKFNSGIYLDFQDFKENKPIPFEKLRTKNKRSVSITYFEELISNYTPNWKLKPNGILTYTTEQDSLIEFELLELWGYTNGRNIYINSIERGYFKDKYDANDSLTWGRDVDYVRIGILGSLSHFTDVDLSDQIMPFNFKPDTDQYLLSIRTGEVMEFNRENMLALIDHDKELSKDFYNNSLNKKKDKLQVVLHQFLRKYNLKYPLSFPK